MQRASLIVALVGGKGVDGCDPRVRNRVGVVIAVDLAHECLAAFEVQLLHLIQPALDDVDGLGMQRGRAAREVGFADYLRLARRVDDDEVVR